MWSQMGIAERDYEVRHALTRVLAELHGPAETRVVLDKLCRTLATDDRDGVAKVLLRIAPTHPHATHDAEIKMRFGRAMRGWRWHPAHVEWSVPPTVQYPPQDAWSAMSPDERTAWILQNTPEPEED